MRFTKCFAENFLSDYKIEIKKVIAKEDIKTFYVHFNIHQPLMVAVFEDFLKGLAKMERELRKFNVSYEFTYDDLSLDNSNLYLDYYRFLITKSLDYQILNLANLNVSFKNGEFAFLVTDNKKITPEASEKIVNLFAKYGLKVTINCQVVDKEEIIAIKQEKADSEQAIM